MNLTKRQREILEFVRDKPGDWLGVCPNHGQQPMFNRLGRAGLLKFRGMATNEEDWPREHPAYVITAEGRAALRAKP